ncbi:MAG: VPLPA-CTERM sorting domain-containing protein [Gammaproteobacteria bacterium]
MTVPLNQYQIKRCTDFNGENFSRAQFQAITPIPLPATVWLFGSGLLGLAGVTRKKIA